MTHHRVVLRLLDRALIGALLLLALLLLGVNAARASGQIVPSVGLTHPVDGDDKTQISGGLAVRGTILPLLMGEIGASYRNDEFFGGSLDVRQWPCRSPNSWWVSPAPVSTSRAWAIAPPSSPSNRGVAWTSAVSECALD